MPALHQVFGGASAWRSPAMTRNQIVCCSVSPLAFLRFSVVKTLSHDPMHGFPIDLRIRQLTDEVIQIGEGSLYPALYRMELKGWIKAEWGVTENNRFRGKPQARMWRAR